MDIKNQITIRIQEEKNTRLDYSNKNYEYFPPCIESKCDVKELNLKHNCLKKVPKWICKLINLTDLSIFDNCLIDLPEEIGLLVHLKCLDIRRNCLKLIPKTIKNLQDLNFLAAESNFLTQIPDEIGYLKKLFVLQLSNNRLETLPISLMFCRSLYALHLERNHIYKLPNNLAFLTDIEFLTASCNQLLYLPSLPFTRKVHSDFSQNSYVNYVSYSFYEKQISSNVCDRWFCHKNHECIMAFRKDITMYHLHKLKNIVLKVKIDQQTKFLLLNDLYKDVYSMENQFFPTLFELALRASFEMLSANDLFNMYFLERNGSPKLPEILINALTRGPVAKCQACNNFIFTESVIWVVPKIIHCIICIKVDVPVLTLVNFCSKICATLFQLLETTIDANDLFSSLKLPWEKIN